MRTRSRSSGCSAICSATPFATRRAAATYESRRPSAKTTYQSPSPTPDTASRRNTSAPLQPLPVRARRGVRRDGAWAGHLQATDRSPRRADQRSIAGRPRHDHHLHGAHRPWRRRLRRTSASRLTSSSSDGAKLTSSSPRSKPAVGTRPALGALARAKDGGGTKFAQWLAAARREFAKCRGDIRVLVFLTDGENDGAATLRSRPSWRNAAAFSKSRAGVLATRTDPINSVSSSTPSAVR